MRVLVIGCGSIGSRRARLLAEMGHEVRVTDAWPGKMYELVDQLAHLGVEEEIGRRWNVDWDEWDTTSNYAEGYDAAFICTPAATHVEIARQCIEAGVPVFVEKPLSLTMDGVPELVTEAESRGLVTMGACNMRWAYGTALVGRLVAAEMRHPDTATFVVRKPLASWREGAVAAYKANGIVLEMAIHEMDLARCLYGTIVGITMAGTADRVEMEVEHEGRRFSMVESRWDVGSHEARHVEMGGRIISTPDTSDKMYRLEMQHFLDCVAESEPTCNPLRSAAHVLEWAIKAQEQIRMVEA